MLFNCALHEYYRTITHFFALSPSFKNVEFRKVLKSITGKARAAALPWANSAKSLKRKLAARAGDHKAFTARVLEPRVLAYIGPRALQPLKARAALPRNEKKKKNLSACTQAVWFEWRCGRRKGARVRAFEWSRSPRIEHYTTKRPKRRAWPRIVYRSRFLQIRPAPRIYTLARSVNARQTKIYTPARKQQCAISAHCPFNAS